MERNSNALRELSEAADRATTTLAAYDMEIRSLDLPGVPDSVWADLSKLCSVLDAAVEEEDLAYNDLDFANGQYALPFGYDPEENDGETDES